MTSFVLVPGACHGGWWYEPLATALQRAGHDARALTLTGLGPDGLTGAGQVSLVSHVAQVTEAVTTASSASSRPVVLVGHSYGGSVITGAADQVPQQVSALVYLDAFVPRDGDSCWSMTNDEQRRWYIDGARRTGLAVDPYRFSTSGHGPNRSRRCCKARGSPAPGRPSPTRPMSRRPAGQKEPRRSPRPPNASPPTPRGRCTGGTPGTTSCTTDLSDCSNCCWPTAQPDQYRRKKLQIVRQHRSGGPEALQVDEIPAPEPGPGELLVEVAVAGVSLPVVRQTRHTRGPWPVAPGGEVAGRVAAIGPEAGDWQIGQRVVSVAFGGAYAEYATVPIEFSAAIPDDIDDGTAVSLLRNGHVALGALRAGGLVEDDRVLVTAAAGGVGHLAVQLARANGARRVVAAVGSAGKETFLENLGADAVVSYADGAPPWEQPVDLVVDGTGGRAMQRGIGALEPFGRLVSLSAAGGTLEVNDLRAHARSVIGFAIAHLARRSPDRYARHRDELWQLAADGLIRAAVHAELPLADAGNAHRVLERPENHGKVILRP